MNQLEGSGDLDKNYDVNFFRPSTPFLKENVRAIGIGLLIWAVAVFGFQILLKLIEKPTGEKAYLRYQQIHPKVQQEIASVSEQRELGVIYLRLLAKSRMPGEIQVLRKALASTLSTLLTDAEKGQGPGRALLPGASEQNRISRVARVLGVEQKPEYTNIIAYALVPSPDAALDDEGRELQKIVAKYFMHNRSLLTDMRILGFPLHYFYTANLLLILFILLCLFYCRLFDRMLKKHGIESPYE